MSYYGYVDHSTFGRVWYRARLRNLNALGNTMEQNIEHGPVVELVAVGKVLLCGGGTTLDEAVGRFSRMLDFYAERGEGLPLDPRSRWRRFRYWDGWPWRRFMWWRLRRRWRREGAWNPVRPPKVRR